MIRISPFLSERWYKLGVSEVKIGITQSILPCPAPSPPKVVETRETPKSHKVIPAATEIPEKKVNTRSGGKRKELSKKYLRLLKFI